MDTQHTGIKQGGSNFWNFIFSIFFIGVLMAALWLMKAVRGGYLISVTPFDALLMALASFRVTRLVVYDKISQWFRDLFNANSHSGFVRTVHDLLSCPWCIGFWSALVIVVCYFIFPWAWTVILFLAVAGAGSLMQIYANQMGWRAENLKIDAQEKAERRQNNIDKSSLGN